MSDAHLHESLYAITITEVLYTCKSVLPALAGEHKLGVSERDDYINSVGAQRVRPLRFETMNPSSIKRQLHFPVRVSRSRWSSCSCARNGRVRDELARAPVRDRSHRLSKGHRKGRAPQKFKG